MALVSRLLALSSLLTAHSAFAHFFLDAPPAAYSQNILGDPQKQPPCGNVNGTPATNAVTTFEAGQTITIRLRETIMHPGHYRVALGVTGPQSLPPEPPVTAGSTACGSTTIQNPPVFPVLADGMLLHTTTLSGQQSFQVTLPSNVTCTNCTLQIFQFMSQHALNVPGGCFYHHCATINVVARDAGVTTMDAGITGGGSAGGGTAGGATSGAGGGASASGGGTSAAGGGEAHVHDTDAGVDPGPVGGCGCTGGSGPIVLAGLVLLGGVLRRRHHRG
jgi:uncharacterized protein (TIGR03382 family)